MPQDQDQDGPDLPATRPAVFVHPPLRPDAVAALLGRRLPGLAPASVAIGTPTAEGRGERLSVVVYPSLAQAAAAGLEANQGFATILNDWRGMARRLIGQAAATGPALVLVEHGVLHAGGAALDALARRLGCSAAPAGPAQDDDAPTPDGYAASLAVLLGHAIDHEGDERRELAARSYAAPETARVAANLWRPLEEARRKALAFDDMQPGAAAGRGTAEYEALEARLNERVAALDFAVRRVAERDRQLAHLERRLAAMTNSRSWRVTAPIRALARTLGGGR